MLIGIVYPIKNELGQYTTSYNIPIWNLEYEGKKYDVDNSSLLSVDRDENKRFRFAFVSDNSVNIIYQV